MGTAASALLYCSAGAAQEGAARGGAGDDMGEDIVVTALKRETSLQDTPVAISAVGETALLRQGASSATDLIRQIPGLNMNETNPAQRRITIRGVQSAGESTVGLYLGETPVSGPNSATSDPSSITPDLNLFDVARVEVLRGPQGTLYGAGSMSGTFKMVFNRPDTDEYQGAFDGSMSSIRGGGTSYATRGMVNIPLVPDLLGFRAVGYFDHRAGYVDNVVLHQKNVNSARSYGGRFMLSLTPAEGISIGAVAILQEQESHDSSVWTPSAGEFNSDAEEVTPFPNSFRMYNLNGDFDLGFATLSLSGSRYTWHGTKFIDGTRTARRTAAAGTYCARYFGISGTCSPAQRDRRARAGQLRDAAALRLPANGCRFVGLGRKAVVERRRLDRLDGRHLSRIAQRQRGQLHGRSRPGDGHHQIPDRV